MLPPVAFASSASLSGQSQQHLLSAALQAESGRTRTDFSANSSNGETGNSNRLNLLSLSGQLQLAQGLSVVASTIGKLIRLDRREGESLSDYTERLSQAMASLTPEQRVLLQKALNQILQGLSIRLLTEILRNPAGPDAAKVALQLELAAYAERDLAEQVVLTSYQENEGEARQPAIQQANPERANARINLAAPRAGANSNIVPTPSPGMPAATTARAPETAPPAAGTPNGESRTSSPTAPLSARQDLPLGRNEGSHANRVADDGGIYHAFDVRSDWDAAQDGESPLAEARNASDVRIQEGGVVHERQQSQDAKAETRREQPEPAAVNRSQTDKTSRSPTPSPQLLHSLNPATLYEAEGVILWLQDLVAKAPSNASDRAREFTENAAVNRQGEREQANVPTAARPGAWAANPAEMPGDAAIETPGFSAAQALAATLAAAAMPASAAGNTQAESTSVIPFPIPYPYPPRGDDFDEEEPLIKPVEATEDERSRGRRRGHSRGGGKPQPEQQEAHPDEPSGDGEAQDYYQRMSGWI